jgi:hypothetical protein
VWGMVSFSGVVLCDPTKVRYRKDPLWQRPATPKISNCIMGEQMKIKTKFNASDVEKTAPLEKIGIIATQNLEGLPHITFINSLMALNDTTMTLGQFIRGNSKYYMQKNPKVSFFILSAQSKKIWTGKILWREHQSQGPELESYKEKPLQRYNSYFPIHRVHYFDLVETTPAKGLPLVKMVRSTLMTLMARAGATQTKNRRPTNRPESPVLKPYGEKLFSSPFTMKFLSFMVSDGFPCLIPFVQCMTLDSRRIVFYANALGAHRHEITANMDLSVFCLKTTLESVLVRGKFAGYKSIYGIKMGQIDIDWVYNSMPPNSDQIYPEKPLTPVTSFDLP